MELLDLNRISIVMNWRGHAGYFNSGDATFPKPVIGDDGVKRYNLEEVKIWDRERPLKKEEAPTTGIIIMPDANNLA